MRPSLGAAALITLACPVAALADRPVPRADWRPVEGLEARLKGQGWPVHNVAVEDGCYEVHGKDETGRRVEVPFHPASLAELGMDD
ncbi:hypothetical protein BDE18_2561 [Paracoccus pantotrophus]|uniref:PepSY domain-containing protein n=1 Tax=Paracoccus pantotrophus TaxID=82367 RepID=A0AAE6NTF6_PARPN|nr:PepSY domain-containing protein [Paracoccus pantotrophus]QFG34687.1 PepSY domain-containing protein [Paracoccus pantotrophus]RKS43745.1 hypothetical protein BDE18_2561 [Paracoccus pantotrophus]